MSRRRSWLAAAVVAAALTVSACGGVPSSSSPQVVRTIGLGETQPAQAPSPPVGADQRTIVQDFIAANLLDPDRHNAARAYLTSDVAQKWNDATVTVVADSPFVVGLFDPATRTVPVSYQQIGSVSASGVYTPNPTGSGEGQPSNATFTMSQNQNEQWRISGLPPGLLVQASGFAQRFTPRQLYFLDGAGRRLVPDLRYSPLPDATVGSFLLGQLIDGPRPELANAVTSEVPPQTGQQRSGVTEGSPTIVQLSGAAALSGDARTRLAAQLAMTLQQRSSLDGPVEIMDGTKTVAVPGVGTRFDASDFSAFAAVDPTAAPPIATFVRDGAVYGSNGKPVSGVLGTARYALTSVAFDRDQGNTLVAGTTPDPLGSRLLAGAGDALADTGIAGVLTRPVWAPGAGEVWVAAAGPGGSTIYRVAPGKSPPAVVQATSRTGPVNGTVESLAFSPEGGRLALVIRSPDATASQVWLASVVRNGPDVRLDQLEPITPVGIDVDDVGWVRDDSSLLAVGQDAAHPGGAFWSLRSDGSALSATSTDGLPARPQAIATSPTSLATWVAVGTGDAATVWTRPSPIGAWTPPSGEVSAEPGSSPSFAI